MLAAVCVIWIINIHSLRASTYGCDIFSNRFTVANGVFKDVCGSESVSTNSRNLNSNASVFPVTNGTVLNLSPLAIFDSYHFSIVIHGKRLPSTNNVPYDIILGPGGNSQSENCQIRYEDANKLGIYCYYKATTYWYPDIALIFDVDELHTLILHYEDRNLQIYQNNQLISTIFSAELDLAFGRIGGWFRDNSPADIGIVNIMFAFERSLQEIRDFVEFCGLYQEHTEVVEENPCWVDQTKLNVNVGGDTNGNDVGLQIMLVISAVFVCCAAICIWMKCCRGKSNGDRSREDKKNKNRKKNNKKKSGKQKKKAMKVEAMEDVVVMDRLKKKQQGEGRRDATHAALSKHIESNHTEVDDGGEKKKNERKASEVAAEPVRDESEDLKDGENDQRKECIVCMDAKREYALMPCKHFILCKQCVLQIGDKCPVCRSKYTSTVRVKARK